MPKLKTLAIAAAASLAFTAPALAADAPVAVTASVVQDVSAADGAITGVVVDAAGKPRADISVNVIHRSQLLGTVKTAADGSYRVAGLKSGNYTFNADGQSRNVRVWNGIAPAGAVDRLALVGGTATVNGNHGHYAPPAPCNTGCQTYAAAPTVTYSQTCQPARTKRCGSNGFLGNGLSNSAAVAGFALGITGVAIASNNSDDIDQLEREVRRRGEIMDAREPFIEDLSNRVSQLEQDLAAANGDDCDTCDDHVSP